MSNIDVVICATVNRPRAGRKRPCGILVDVVEEFGESVADHLLIVRHAPTLLPALLYVLCDGVSVLRVDRPRSRRRPGERPLLLHSTDDVDRWVQSALPALSGPQFEREYPLSVWAAPEAVASDAHAAIDAFDASPGDASLLDRIRALGVSRLAMFPSSASLSVPCEMLEATLERVRPVIDESPVPVEWA